MKFPEVMQKYLPLWAVAAISSALIIGYYFPGVKVLKPAIPFLLFLMLYPMMINLKVEDIKNALKNPKLFSIAVLMNFLLTPLLGALWTHVLFSHTDPYLAVGFILKVTVPCSGMVAAWTGYAEGRVESALVVVALSLIMAIFLVPFWMWVLAGIYVSVNPLMIFKKMLLIVVIPLLLGLVTRKILVRKYGIATYKKQVAPYFPAVSTCGMLPMVFIIISTQAKLIVANFQWIVLVVLGIGTLYPTLFILAILFSKMAHIDYGNGMALGYSVTAKNHAITIGIATTAFGGTLAVLPAAVAPIIQIPIMLLCLKLSNRIKTYLPLHE
jgi:arsenite transporter